MKGDDLSDVAEIHAAVFSRQTRSFEWIASNYGAYPRILYYVAEENDIISGFILKDIVFRIHTGDKEMLVFP